MVVEDRNESTESVLTVLVKKSSAVSNGLIISTATFHHGPSGSGTGWRGTGCDLTSLSLNGQYHEPEHSTLATNRDHKGIIWFSPLPDVLSALCRPAQIKEQQMQSSASASTTDLQVADRKATNSSTSSTGAGRTTLSAGEAGKGICDR